MTGLEQYFSEEPRVYHIEGEAFATSEHDDLNKNNAGIPPDLWK